MAGGETPSNSNTIDQITVETAGNATDFGDLTSVQEDLSGGGELLQELYLVV